MTDSLQSAKRDKPDAKTLTNARCYYEREIRNRPATVYEPTARDLMLAELKKCIDALADAPATLQARVEALETQYHDLLMSVETKHEGETRHETARRYILEAEKRNRGDGKAALAAA